MVLPLWLLSSGRLNAGTEISLHNSSCTVTFDPATLAVNLRSGGQPAILVSAAQTSLGTVADLEGGAIRARWSLPKQKVSITLELGGNRLLVHVLGGEPSEFTFPVIPETASAKGWILPFFEGVYASCGDARWVSFLTNRGELNTTADLTMPFLGLDYGRATLTCILTNPFNNRLEFRRSPDNALQARLTHQFTRNHPVNEYGVVFEVGTNSLVEPARIYRQWLIQRGEFVSFKDKIRKTPEAGKLPGAAHAYLWGHELLTQDDVTNWRKFARDLKTQGEGPTASPGRRIWSLMKPEARGFVAKLIQAEWPDRYMKSQIAADLDRLLRQRDLYAEPAWHGVALDPQCAALLKSDPSKLSQADLCRLNSHLLAAAFPNLLAKPETWGDGTSPKMIQELARAGFDRFWLGSDGWDGLVERPETVAAAKKAGFLIGPYDSYNGIHRPNEPDTWETAQFDTALYETGAIVNADGSKRRGFKQKGFTLSPDAARPYVEKRVSGLMAAFHANSWFIDCDGFGEYFDDYSDKHPATQQSDMQSRISRMSWIRDTFGEVIGTEGCSAGVASIVHFAHGVMTPVIGWGDPDLSNKQSKYYLGAYYPPGEPQVFFKPVPLKEEYRYIYFEPRFRLPLFQTVFHDSVIATHHWSFASLKEKDQARTVELLELLYQVPPLYHLNMPEFQKRKTQIKRHYEFFSPLHRETTLLPMTGFQWLTPDAAVQRTTFGDNIEMVANFGPGDFRYGDTTLRKESILVKRRDSGRTQVYVAQ
ncbi:MAG: glycoside hydrolase [Limisphaerales bacterium]